MAGWLNQTSLHLGPTQRLLASPAPLGKWPASTSSCIKGGRGAKAPRLFQELQELQDVIVTLNTHTLKVNQSTGCLKAFLLSGLISFISVVIGSKHQLTTAPSFSYAGKTTGHNSDHRCAEAEASSKALRGHIREAVVTALLSSFFHSGREVNG